MKTIIFYASGLIIALMLAGSPVYAASNSDDLERGLQLMREEEKLAHDVYLALYEKWQVPVFTNIANAESRHYDAVGYLLETYGVEDTAYEKEGKFKNEDMANLYTELVEKGSSSLESAFEVGALIEELDIQDLQEQLGAGNDDLVTTVFGNLERASEMHLRAFTNQLAMRGIDYTPQILDKASFLAITDTAPGLRGRGNRMLAGNGVNTRGFRGNGNCLLAGNGVNAAPGFRGRGNQMLSGNGMNTNQGFRGSGNCLMVGNGVNTAPGFRGRGNCMLSGNGMNVKKATKGRQNFGMRNRGQQMRVNCIYN